MTRTIQLSDGKHIPAVGWGNGTGGLHDAGQTAIDTGKLVLESGILHIDTAQWYKTERETAGAIAAAGIPREKVWITTKISANSVAAEATTAANVRQSVLESLERLGTKPDLLLVHNPYVPEKGKIAEFWTYLEDLVLDGTLAGVSLGVSNYRPVDLRAVLGVARIKPVVNQLEYHPYLLAQYEAELLPLQKEHGIVTQAYGPLTPLLRHPTGGPLKPVLERIAQRYKSDVDAASILLLWTVQTGVVAITSSRNPANIRKIAAVDKLPDLTAQDITDIEEAGRKVHFRHYTEHLYEDFAVPDLPADV